MEYLVIGTDRQAFLGIFCATGRWIRQRLLGQAPPSGAPRALDLDPGQASMLPEVKRIAHNLTKLASAA